MVLLTRTWYNTVARNYVARNEVEREEDEPHEFHRPEIVNDNNHPSVAASYDKELARVKRQCDKLKEELIVEKEQCQTTPSSYYLINNSDEDFRLKEEN
jgi:hypothetical protein